MKSELRKSHFHLQILLFAVIFLSITVCLNGLNPLPSHQDDEDKCPRTPFPTDSCPINCFRPDPVCGVDGVTYWCGCPDAHCAGVRVAKLGPCSVGNGGSAAVPGQALLLFHIVWLIFLGISLIFGLL
uniref:Putative ovule protein n=1 Tax=Solanum chacoense TaxID=4108 RepID=A0A0V0HZI4_SOLCH